MKKNKEKNTTVYPKCPGDVVYPKSSGGLELCNVPCDGTHDQNRPFTCYLKGKGRVIEVNEITIDYDTWPDTHEGVGKVVYQNCLIQCENGVGWAGAGALV